MRATGKTTGRTETTMARTIEIGYSRERVELLDEPRAGRPGRIGRIRHANGENVPIDHATLERLVERARETRRRERAGTRRDGLLEA